MNYFELINRFWRCDLEHSLTAGDTRLYFYLLHTCNQLGWKMPFGHSDRHLAMQVGLAVSNIRNCKERLQQRGLIAFCVPKIKSKAFDGQTQFWFPTVLKNNTVPDTVPNTVPLTNTKQDQTKQEYNINPLYSLFEKNNFLKNDFKNQKVTKDNPTNIKVLQRPKELQKRRKVAQKEEKGQEVILPFTSPEFTQNWDTLLKMPKWKEKQAQSLLMTLKKLAEYEEGFAVYLLELAIANDWQGLIYPDLDSKYQQWKQNKIPNGNKTINCAARGTKSIAPETIQPERNYKERF